MTARDLLATLATLEDDQLDNEVYAVVGEASSYRIRSVETDEDSVMLMEAA